MPQSDALVIRPAHPADTAALARLAELDSAPALRGPVLVAELDGRIVAALATDSGARVADPFVATAGLLTLLELRARPLPPRRRGRTGLGLRARAA